MDTEYTNGNYYLVDIFEIAVLAESSGYIFHSYINIQCETIPRYVKRMCNVSDAVIKASPSFCEVMDDLVEFIQQEEAAEAKTKNSIPITIIAHGGYLFDFPLLLANCMNKRYDFHPKLEKYKFVDSVKVLQSLGYKQTSLDVLGGGERRTHHSAVQDVERLRNIIKKLIKEDDITNISYTYTLYDIVQYLNGKLPISMGELYILANAKDTSYEAFESALRVRAIRKTALNEKQICKIAYRYFFNK